MNPIDSYSISFRNRIIALGLIIASPTILGCRDSSKPAPLNTEAETPEVAPDKNANKPTIVEPAGTIQDKSPATADSDLPAAAAAPDIVCLRFMNLLKSGNRLAAERLLTRRAETVTNRGGFPIQPLGGPTAEFQMGDVHYATNKQQLAHVDCKITDSLNGQLIESNVTWLVRKQNEGWRIAGIIFKLADDQPADLLSFENPDDMAHLKALVEQQTADASQTSTKGP